MSPWGRVDGREVSLGPVAGVECVADQFPMGGTAPAFGLPGVPIPWMTSRTTSTSALVRGRSAIWTRWLGRAGQISTRPGSMRTGSPVRTVKRGRRIVRACRGGSCPGWLGGYHFPSERLAGCAQLGQDEWVFQRALGVVSGLRALQRGRAGLPRWPHGRGGAAVGRRRRGSC